MKTFCNRLCVCLSDNDCVNKPKPTEEVKVLYNALRHLHHNAKKYGAEMGLALEVSKQAINEVKKKYGDL